MIRFSDQEILDRISDGVIAIDSLYNFLYINPPAKRFLGANGNIVGKNVFKTFPVLEKSTLKKIFDKVIKEDKPKTYEYTTSSGNRTFYISLYPAPWGITAFVKNISAEKKIEKELQQSRKQLELLMEKTTDVVEILDEKGDILFINKRAKGIAGYPSKEVIGKSIFSFLQSADVERMKNNLHELLKNPNKQIVVQARIKHRNGNLIWIEALATNLLNDPNINGIIVNLRDITEAKKAEESLFYYAALSRSIGDAVISIDLHGRIVTWNIGAESIYGWKAQEVLGKDAVKLLDGVTESGISAVEYIEKSWEEKIANEGNWSGIIQQKTKTGDVKDVQLTITYIKNDEGENIGYIAVCRDITQLKELERNKDKFISMASHELKTPLTSTILFTQVLEKRFKKISDTESQKLLQKMNTNLSKLSALVGYLLDVSKLQQKKIVLKKQEFLLNSLIKEITEDIQPISKHKIILRSKIKIYVTADKEKIRQVIINLITNAIKYDPSEKPIIITIEQKGQEVILSVKDFGIGIPRSEVHRIFNQFYQVSNGHKYTYPGLGLGLFISSEIIHLHKGSMWVTSQLGKGSKFSFSLPST